MFKFGFSGDDINSDTEDDVEDVESTNGTSPQIQCEHEEYSSDRTLRLYDISDLLTSIPSRLSYSQVAIPFENIEIPRREVFDIKLQIMADEDVLPTLGDTSKKKDEDLYHQEIKILLSNTEDIRTNVYEGGLKSWEGAQDLVQCLAEEHTKIGNGVLEFGCGSALPSLYLFQQYVTEILHGNGQSQNVTFVLSDYNLSVLELMTAPNFLIAYHKCICPDKNESDLIIKEDTVQSFINWLDQHKISIKLVAGPWDAKKFADLLGYSNSGNPKLRFSTVLASETIYSGASIAAFVPSMLSSLTLWHSTTGDFPKGYIAAKEIYFGVGGTVLQFLEEAKRYDSSVEILIKKRISPEQVSGVSRVILQAQKL
ncbi:uncharacterized protein V1516DRAFT_676613 [Lipomyces oligophaga]|uniref:uncharacterized protein n=1 Tax=Lipomyces oligophaga TaxID=45792 RepID=UPI0034CEAFA9